MLHMLVFVDAWADDESWVTNEEISTGETMEIDDSTWAWPVLEFLITKNLLKRDLPVEVVFEDGYVEISDSNDGRPIYRLIPVEKEVE